MHSGVMTTSNSFGEGWFFAAPQCLHCLRKCHNSDHVPLTWLSFFELYIVYQPGAVHHVTSCSQQVALYWWVNTDTWIWSGRDCECWKNNAQRSYDKSLFFGKSSWFVCLVMIHLGYDFCEDRWKLTEGLFLRWRCWAISNYSRRGFEFPANFGNDLSMSRPWKSPKREIQILRNTIGPPTVGARAQ